MSEKEHLKKVIGYAIDKDTVGLTTEGLSIMFESVIRERGREAFEEMMEHAGWVKVQSSASTARKEK